MKKSLELLSKTYYDISFVRNYVKNGKGNGTGFLAFVALIMALIVTVAFIFQIRVLYNSDKMNVYIDEFLAKAPKIAIENGELQYEEHIIQEYKFSDLSFEDMNLSIDEDITVLVIDTTNNNPSLQKIKSSVFYLTKTDIYTTNPKNGQMRKTSLAEIQKTFGKNPVEVTSKENLNYMVKFMQGFMGAVIVLFFIIGFIFDWLVNIVLAIITRFFAVISNKKLDKLGFSERRRAAAAAVAPVLLVIAVLQSIFVAPNTLVKWVVVIVTGIILMTKFASPEETTEDKTENPKS